MLKLINKVDFHWDCAMVGNIDSHQFKIVPTRDKGNRFMRFFMSTVR